MNVKPYPTLDGRGYLKEVGSVADAIFADYHRSQSNQSDHFKIRSLSEDLNKDPDPNVVAANIQDSLQYLLTQYIPRAVVRCEVQLDVLANKYGLAITMSVTDGNVKRDLGRLMKINGTKIEELVGMSAKGEQIRYPIEHRDFEEIWGQ